MTFEHLGEYLSFRAGRAGLHGSAEVHRKLVSIGCGASYQAVWAWMNGISRPTKYGHAKAVASLLNITDRALLYEMPLRGEE